LRCLLDFAAPAGDTLQVLAHTRRRETTMGGDESFDWRTLSGDELERHFNPRIAVPDALDCLDRYTRRSAECRNTLPGQYDCRFGDGEKCTYDFHPAEAGDNDGNTPLVIFIHGGYWRLMDKSDHSFVAPPYCARGFGVVNLNYDLCPGVSLDVIVDETKQAFLHIWAQAETLALQRERIYLIGHSAGAHLAASLLGYDWEAEGLPADPIAGIVAISGIYEPEAARRISLNEEIGLTEEVAARNDMLAMKPKSKADILSIAGASEPEGWIAQSVAYAARCTEAGMDASFHLAPDCHHFAVMEAAADPGNETFEKIMQFLA
jgi:arylformamidase